MHSVIVCMWYASDIRSLSVSMKVWMPRRHMLDSVDENILTLNEMSCVVGCQSVLCLISEADMGKIFLYLTPSC